MSNDLKEHQQKYANAIEQARFDGQDRFQAWFNQSADLHEALNRGYWDFSTHILTQKVCERIERPEEMTALELGYGGGRILNAACSYFKSVVGIDIHHEQATVEALLAEQGKTNFTLVHTDGNSIDVPNASIDFIYSFIVLQHLSTFAVFQQYLQEVSRCLKPGGVAQLYFGRFSLLSLGDQVKYFLQGYYEIPDVPVNHTSLVIRTAKVKKVGLANGLIPIDQGNSYKQAPDGYRQQRGGQNFVAFLKG